MLERDKRRSSTYAAGVDDPPLEVPATEPSAEQFSVVDALASLDDEPTDSVPAETAEPSAAQLEAQLAEERRQTVDAAPAIDPPLEGVAEAIAELAQRVTDLAELDGPPEDATVQELMASLEELGELGGDLFGAQIVEIAEAIVALSQRPAPPTPEELSERLELEQLEKARQAYAKKVNAIRGEGRELPPCPACDGIGFDLTGGGPPVQLKPHQHFRECHECDGVGKVLTGSHVPELETADCPGCGARGYVSLQVAPAHADGTAPESGAEPVYGREPWMGDPNVAPVYPART